MDRYVPLPPLPERIGRLNELACNLWWSWHATAREVFRELDYPLWRFTSHNPVLLLHLVEPERLEFAACDPEFLRIYDSAVASFDAVCSGADTWWEKAPARGERRTPGTGPIAWIAPQFALHQSLPVYVTSEGVIAGDLAKEASDLGIPFVGVGLMFARTYGHQRLATDGTQQETVEFVDWSDAPISPAALPDGSACRLQLTLAGADIAVCVWQVLVGRTTIYLLDTDLPENPAWERELSSRRCDGDADARLRQSILLAAGSVALLDALGITPAVWHLAGGQAALVSLDRIHRLVLGGAAFADACAQVRASTVFDVRVDAPPAKDSYALAAVDLHLASTWPALALQRGLVLALGQHETNRGDAFNGAVLGARTCGTVALETGAIHLASWVSGELSALLDSQLGRDWASRAMVAGEWAALMDLPDDALWEARQRLRGYLISFMRERARRRWAREQVSGARIVALGTLLDEAALTIGCVPRFGDGANADVLFKEVERLARICTATRRPVQFVFAGRVDGRNDIGKHHLQRTFRHTLDPAFGGRLAFVEDYDLHVGRLMVQGCDLWLTMPSPEGGASLGAIKAAVNGAPQIGPPGSGDPRWTFEDARALYAALEEQIVPAFYDRNRANVPERWTATVRSTLAESIPRYAARRVVKSAIDRSSLTRV
jgi:starch phosphorylase